MEESELSAREEARPPRHENGAMENFVLADLETREAGFEALDFRARVAERLFVTLWRTSRSGSGGNSGWISASRRSSGKRHRTPTTAKLNFMDQGIVRRKK